MPFADLVSPLFGVIGILSALRMRDATGDGQFVDVSMLGAVTSLVASEPFELLERFGIAARTGNSTIRLTPFGIFRTADGHVAICATNDHECERLFGAIGRPSCSPTSASPRCEARVANHRVVEAHDRGVDDRAPHGRGRRNSRSRRRRRRAGARAEGGGSGRGRAPPGRDGTARAPVRTALSTGAYGPGLPDPVLPIETGRSLAPHRASASTPTAS